MPGGEEGEGRRRTDARDRDTAREASRRSAVSEASGRDSAAEADGSPSTAHGTSSETPAALRKHRLWVFLLLLVALTTRLAATQFARFAGDEGDQWSNAVRTARLERLPLLGQPITGSSARTPGPAFELLMAVPQLLGPSPWYGTVFTALLNLAALVLAYRLATRFAGRTAGYALLALGAVAPWAIVHGDRIWSANVLPIFGALSFYAAVEGARNPRWQAVLVLVAGILPQIHLSAPAVWLGCIVYIILTPGWKPSPRWLAVGAVLTVLAYVPPLSYELSNDFANLRAILAHTGGGESMAYVRTLPVRILGTVVGQGTSEISYQLMRGYWAWSSPGPYDGLRMLGTMEGLGKVVGLYGPVASVLTALSVLLALVGWGHAFGRLGLGLGRLVKLQGRSALAAGDRFTLSLLVAAFTALVLMMASRKLCFPHYLAFLVPLSLWPIAGSVACWMKRRKARAAVLAALVVSATSMLWNGSMYYRNVDTLDGLRTTLSMVKEILADQTPASVRFDHLPNGGPWNQLANVYLEQPLDLRPTGSVRYHVRNREAHRGPIPFSARLHGGRVLLERDSKGVMSGLVFRAIRRSEDVKVSKVGPNGTITHCSGRAHRGRTDDPRPHCSYGGQPWERFGPDAMTFRGQSEAVLFLHPVAGQVVAAEFPEVAEARRGRLYFGLSDGAVASSNRALVNVRLLQGERVVVAATAGANRGLTTRSFELTGSSPLRLELTTENDGARIFGFDLDLAR